MPIIITPPPNHPNRRSTDNLTNGDVLWVLATLLTGIALLGWLVSGLIAGMDDTIDPAHKGTSIGARIDQAAPTYLLAQWLGQPR